MKTKLYILRAAIVLVPLLLSACASTGAPVAPALSGDPVGAKVQAVRVAYTGVVESMEGSQWTVNSQSITVDPSVVQDGPFKVGDTIKIEGQVQADGSILITRIELPSAQDLSDSVDVPSLPVVEVPAELIFDDDGNEAWGTVEALTADSITVSGQTFPFAAGAEINGMVVIGSFVKLEFLVNADGTLSVREVKLADPSDVGDGEDDNDANENDNDDNGNENDNDDNGNENDNDDNGNENENDDNGNDDNGNENDDNGNDDNGNDDNSNDDDNDDSNDDNGEDNGNDDSGEDNGNDGGENENDD